MMNVHRHEIGPTKRNDVYFRPHVQAKLKQAIQLVTDTKIATRKKTQKKII